MCFAKNVREEIAANVSSERAIAVFTTSHFPILLFLNFHTIIESVLAEKENRKSVVVFSYLSVSHNSVKRL